MLQINPLQMNDYIETRIETTPCDETTTDILAALLADIGYESFVPDSSGLTAYIKKEDFNEDRLGLTLETFPMPGHKFTTANTTVEGKDWNNEWEKNYFKPIVVDDVCVIHSSFHHDFPKCKYDIVIDPKMAFGTGHHSTTSLIIRNLLNADLSGKSVIDMGTGTGILAILAAMRGASPVTAIEIDPFAQVNAVENVALNHHPEIRVILGDASELAGTEPADVFLANINRNIITADLPSYSRSLKPGGTIFLSGFYVNDVDIVKNAAEKEGLVFDGYTEHENWACIKMHRP